MKIKNILYIIPLLLAFSAKAYNIPVGDKSNSFMGVDIVNIAPTIKDKVQIDIKIDLRNVNIRSQFEQIFTPYMYSGTDTVRFESFAITGHKRLLSNERNNRVVPITFYKGKLKPGMPASGMIEGYGYKLSYPDNGRLRTLPIYDYTLTANWQPWMENAIFSIESEVRGCANCIKNIDGITEEWLPLAQTEYVQLSYFPEFLYVTPQAEAVKTREISARAYIDFVVNRTEINPTYRRNPVELAKIRATIDSVKNDKDISITKLHISGTASPEGSYENNVRLAKGRTEALKNYVQSLYRFPYGFITTSYDPVDWVGLSQFLKLVINIENGSRDFSFQSGNNAYAIDSIRADKFKAIRQFLSADGVSPSDIPSILPHAREILNIVNDGLEPYQRNSKIRTTYPKEYAWLLANVYPALRHSDYRIEFEIKHFTEAPEIIEVMQTQPSKLSLEELFVAANSQPVGSQLYNQAFDLAVTMYPNDETANLNAAINAMRRGNINIAANYLPKAGNSPAAEYAKAILTLMQGYEDEAISMFDVLSNSLNPVVATKALEAKQGLENVRNSNGFHFKKME